MATQLQFRRGTTAQNNSFTGADGEVSIDKGSKGLRIHDGATAGGYEVVPAGTIVAYGGASAPIGWLLCDAAAVSRTTYARLFAIVGTAFGVGDGSSTFNTPNLADRLPLGKGSNNGTVGATGSAAAASGVLTSAAISGVQTGASNTGTGTSGTGTTGTGNTGTGTSGTATTGAGNTGTGTTAAATQALNVGTGNVAASAKDSSLTAVVTSVNTAAHSHSIPALSVAGLSVPGLSVPALSVPGLSIPALTIPTMTTGNHTHSVPALAVPALSVPGLSVPALTVPALTVANHTAATALPFEITNFIIKI